ncbi:hypothetical protein ACOSQ3_004698 [Xanthoceras sorbifolium]
MEGKSSLSDTMTQHTLSGFQDLLGPMQFHHHPHPHFYQHGSEVQPQTTSDLPIEYMQEQAVSFVNYNENERGKSLVRDGYAMDCAVTGVDGHLEVDKERVTPWQRIKWTEKMVKLLITAVSYIGQCASGTGGRTESSLLLKIGKWKLLSKLMVERGYHASPQQCEDKFNNLNKGYKRFNDVLGKGTACMVVQNPKLLDEMDISGKAKEDVKKLLSSKQLFYEEMCSYHNGNQLYLPRDPDLERSLQLALGKKDDYRPHSKWYKADNEQDHDAIADGQANEIETEDIGGMFVCPEVSATMSKKVNDDRVSEASNAMKFVGFNAILETSAQYGHTDLNPVCPEGEKSDELQKQWMAFRSSQLRLQKLQVKAQLHKLEKQRIKWQGKCWKHDRELNKMKLQNERLKIENERMAIELKYKERSAHYNLTV